MDKQTLSNYGWIVVMILCLSVMLAFATPFGKAVGSGIKVVIDGFGDTLDKTEDKYDEDKEYFDDLFSEYEITDLDRNEDENNLPTIYMNYEYVMCAERTQTVPEIGRYYKTIKEQNNIKLKGNITVTDEMKKKISRVYIAAMYLDDESFDLRQGLQAAVWCILENKTVDELNLTGLTDTAKNWVDKLNTKANTIDLKKFTVYISFFESIEDKDKYQNIVAVSVPKLPANPDGPLGWQVPKDCTYTMKDAVNGKSVYTEYEYLPYGYESASMDILESPDYNYTCKDISGWNVKVKDTSKTEYEPFLTKINDKSLVSLYETFRDCASLTVAPVIPVSVKGINNTFMGCSSLTTAPKIPDGLISMSSAFAGCSSLKTYVGSTDPDGDFSNYNIPSDVSGMSGTFANCSLITNAPVLPENIQDLRSTFTNCTSLIKMPEIPKKVKLLGYTFYNCTSLKEISTISNSVEYMDGTFYGCTSLTAAPVIPDSVINMKHTFYNCTSLTVAPTIPENVTDMTNTFLGCTSLTGTITINANPTDYNGCFLDVDMSKVSLTGTSSLLEELKNTGKN